MRLPRLLRPLRGLEASLESRKGASDEDTDGSVPVRGVPADYRSCDCVRRKQRDAAPCIRVRTDWGGRRSAARPRIGSDQAGIAWYESRPVPSVSIVGPQNVDRPSPNDSRSVYVPAGAT